MAAGRKKDLQVEERLHRQVKLAAVEDGTTLEKFVAGLLEAGLRQRARDRTPAEEGGE